MGKELDYLVNGLKMFGYEYNPLSFIEYLNLVNGLKMFGYEYVVNDSDKERLEIVKRSYEQDGSISETKAYYFKKNTDPQICVKEETLVPFTEERMNLYLKYFEKMGYEKTDFVNFFRDPVYKSKDSNYGVSYYFTIAKMNIGENGRESFVIIIEYYLNTSEFKTK